MLVKILFQYSPEARHHHEVTNQRVATEIICYRTPSQLQIMRQTYCARFGCHVEHDVTMRTSDDRQHGYN
jgi:hypothetical protein